MRFFMRTPLAPTRHAPIQQAFTRRAPAWRWAGGLTLALVAWSGGALAQAHSAKERAEDAARHRAMAAAHDAAARCLASTTDEKTCMAELQAACKGLAIGKYCGMRHVH